MDKIDVGTIRIKRFQIRMLRHVKKFRKVEIFNEAFLNRIDAENREEYLKGGYGRKTIKSMLNKFLK